MIFGGLGTLWLIVFFICLIYLIAYSLSPKRSLWARFLCWGLTVGAFIIPYFHIVTMLAGALCWAESRMPN